jgi:hypothetical protein
MASGHEQCIDRDITSEDVIDTVSELFAMRGVPLTPPPT